MYDVIIIGGGPAGLSAGIYAKRDGLNAVLFDRVSPGGQVVITDEIENYPGFANPIKGMQLMEAMQKQAERFGLAIFIEEVKSVFKKDELFVVVSDKKEYVAKTVLIATGSAPGKLNVPGEEKFIGKGVSYCATCDAPFFKDRNLLVVGGGDSALDEALFLTRFARSVTVIHRRYNLRATKGLQEKTKVNSKIKFLLGAVVEEIKGSSKVTSVVIKDLKDGKREEISFDGVFIFVGSIPNTSFLGDFLSLDESGCIVVDINMETSVKGVYACGDVRSGSVRQIASSVGDGVTAIMNIEKMLIQYG